MVQVVFNNSTACAHCAYVQLPCRTVVLSCQGVSHKHLILLHTIVLIHNFDNNLQHGKLIILKNGRKNKKTLAYVMKSFSFRKQPLNCELQSQNYCSNYVDIAQHISSNSIQLFLFTLRSLDGSSTSFLTTSAGCTIHLHFFIVLIFFLQRSASSTFLPHECKKGGFFVCSYFTTGREK